MNGTLYIVSTPIGNIGDITQRAIQVLHEADTILCEDLREGRRLLHALKIEKDLLPLNEHTTRQTTNEAHDLLLAGKTLALISDAGTPLFADPGSQLVRLAIESEIAVHPIPGASSLLAALVISGFSLERFTFAGFLSRDKDQRLQEVKRFRDRNETLVFLEAPYRLQQMLENLAQGIGESRQAAICMNLTLPTERVRRGTLLTLKEYFAQHPFKGEFVIVVEGVRSGRRPQIRGNEEEESSGRKEHRGGGVWRKPKARR